MTVESRERVRRWREDKPSGLAVVDVPQGLVGELGGVGRCACRGA